MTNLILRRFNTENDLKLFYTGIPKPKGFVYIKETETVYIYDSKWITLGVVDSKYELTGELDILNERLFLKIPDDFTFIESKDKFGIVDVGYEFHQLEVIEVIDNKIYFDSRNLLYYDKEVSLNVKGGYFINE
jgi:hypothetical protein